MSPYPLIRSGGLFLLIVGATIIAGTFLPRARSVLLVLGLTLASIATAIAAPRLTQPLGIPTWPQILALAGSVLLEILLIPAVIHRVQQRGERTIILSVFLVIGLHFLPMTFAFGPIIGILGVVTILNASAGIWLFPALDLSIFWLLDGIVKLVCGMSMLLAVLG